MLSIRFLQSLLVFLADDIAEFTKEIGIIFFKETNVLGQFLVDFPTIRETA